MRALIERCGEEGEATQRDESSPTDSLQPPPLQPPAQLQEPPPLQPPPSLADNDRPRDLLRREIFILSGSWVLNFQPLVAAAIFRRFAPAANAVVYDPSAGWGGRLLGAAASGNVSTYSTWMLPLSNPRPSPQQQELR